MTQTTESLRCLHDLLMHMYTHVFAFIHSIRMNGWLPSSGQEGGPLALFYEIQEATLHGLYTVKICHSLHQVMMMQFWNNFLDSAYFSQELPMRHSFKGKVKNCDQTHATEKLSDVA